MKALVWKNNLKEGLDIVEKAIAKSSALPILQNISLKTEKGNVVLAGTDLQIGITYTFGSKVEKEGMYVFNGRFLSSLLGVLAQEQVSLEGEGGRLTVSSGEDRTTINTLDPEEFPIIPSMGEDDVRIEVDGNTWCRGLGQVVGMVGQSQTRPEISGVLVAVEKKAVKVVATDSFRLAEKTLLLEKESATPQSFILPQRTAREVVAIFSEKGGTLTIHLSSSQAVFDYTKEEGINTHIQVVSRLIEGEYPRYEDVIPAGEKTKIRLKRQEFLNHVKGAGVFAGKTNEVRLQASPEKNTLSFFAESSEAGKHTATLAAEVAGEEGEAAFNWRFLAEGLSQIKADFVEFACNGEDGPAMLKSSEQEGFRYVIMPIKA